MELSKELLPSCVICKKQWKREETDKYVYHDSRGVVCVHHTGVMEWYQELIDRDNEYLRGIGCLFPEN